MADKGKKKKTKTEVQPTVKPADKSPVKKNEAELLKEQLKEKEDQLLRLAADYDNFRKRSERDAELTRKFASEGLISELLAVLDDLERAMTSGKEKGEKGALLEGVEMTHKRMCDVMARYGLARIPCAGTPFDPAVHEAVMQEESSRPEGEVLEEFQAGYRMHDKVIRASCVKVAKKKDKKQK